MTTPEAAAHLQVTAGVIERNGTLLITRRPEGSHLAGYWEFPGGKQEEGETLRDCLVREIREELRVRVRVTRLLMTADHDYGHRVVHVHFFACGITEGEPSAILGQELRWVKPAELTTFRFPPPDRSLVEVLSRPCVPA